VRVCVPRARCACGQFPDGFAAVAEYIHSLGLQSGLYTAAGPRTCKGRAASCDHEMEDAAQWATWGIDFVSHVAGVAGVGAGGCCMWGGGGGWGGRRVFVWCHPIPNFRRSLPHYWSCFLRLAAAWFCGQVKDDACTNCPNTTGVVVVLGA
jgi:hypothetical protein